MEPSKSSQTSKSVANNPEFQALMQGFAANLATFLDNALSASNVKAEPSSHVKADPSGSLPIDLTQYPRIKDEKADSHSHGQMVIDLTAEPGTDVDASFKNNDLFAEDDAELPLTPSTKFPLPSKPNLLSGSARDTKASSTRPSVRDKSSTNFVSSSDLSLSAISSTSPSQRPVTMSPIPPRRELSEDTDEEAVSSKFQRKKHKRWDGWRGPYARPNRKYGRRYLDFEETESQQSSTSSASVLRTANVDMDDDYVPNDDDDSDGGEKRRRLAARHLKVGKRSQAASASLSSRLPLPHATGGRKTGDSAHQNLGDSVADFNAIDSDEDFLTYNTVLVRASHAHKALVRAELEKPYMAKWVKEAKDTAPGFAGTNNRAHITVLLKHLYESDRSKYDKWISHLRAEVQIKLDNFGSALLKNWLNTNVDEDTCFSGVFLGFPDANLTEALQIAISFTSQKLHWAQYQTIDLTLQRFKTASNTPIRKKFWLVVDYSPANFQNLLSGHCEISHRCDWRRCTNPRHIVVEHHNTNVGRTKCFRKAELDAESGHRLPRLCRDHDPPCLLQRSSLPVASRVLLEYEHVGNELPAEVLPPQTQSTNGPYILNSGVPLYRWENNKRVLKHQYAAPMVGPVFPLTQAPSMTYSGTNFTLAVGGLPQPLD